ncbi:MAG: lytic transglycosylase domain-containing protein [Alphaproteobacteria bacterium]|nr:lytic transglycosylase domain-containing protein [Alphaproteobacteria bacterium]
MRRILYGYIAIFAAASVIGFAPNGLQTAQAAELTAQTRKIYSKAFTAGDEGRWKQAAQIAKSGRHPLANKLLTWQKLRAPNSGADFDEIAGFVMANPDWPDLPRMRRRAEEAMGPDVPSRTILEWFDRFPPTSPDGAFHLGRTLLNAGRTAEAERVIREAWIGMAMGRKQAADFRKRFRRHLRPEDDIARLERLLWDRKVRPSRRQMRYVSKGWRRLAEARIALIVRSRKAQQSVRKIPKSLRGNDGILFDQVRWHRRRQKMDKAVSMLLAGNPTKLGRPERWWHERQLLARWALREEQPDLAYQLASSHHQSAGRAYAAAEWLAGWIALRKLNRPDDALKHFQAMHQKVKFPVSRSRGAYWSARAYEALEKHEEATAWYRKAAQYVTRFYGQLAAGHLLESERPRLPAEDEPNEFTVGQFQASDMARATRILAELDRRDDVKRFLVRLGQRARVPGDWVLAARLSQDVGRHDVGVHISKRALREGVILSTTGYPALVPADIDDENFPEASVIHGLVRQESAFDSRAISRAGARGLMQLMPGTALRVARQLKLPYSRRRLTRDPRYNLKLGQAYLADMLEDYDGSLILALAAYNAGPLRVERWLRRNGDPGPNIYAAIDWIESIPFTETRNYVQRVLENRTVYRTRENGLNIALTLAAMEPGPGSLERRLSATVHQLAQESVGEAAETPPARRFALALESAAGTRRIGVSDRPVRIGVGPEVDVVVPGTAAGSEPREYALIWASGNDLVLHASGRDEECRVNGDPVTWARLDEGDAIAVAGIVLVVQVVVPRHEAAAA